MGILSVHRTMPRKHWLSVSLDYVGLEILLPESRGEGMTAALIAWAILMINMVICSLYATWKWGYWTGYAAAKQGKEGS